MYRIDNANSSATPPTPPAAGTEQYFQDTSPGGGTNVPAWWLTMVQEEIRKVVTDAGLTPDKTDNGQLSEAISVLGKTAGVNPFVNFAWFREEQTAGTHAGTSTTGFNTRGLNTTVTNGITGCSFNSGTGEITLPAGDYILQGYATCVGPGGDDPRMNHKLLVYDGSSYIASGPPGRYSDMDAGNDQMEISTLSDYVTLATSKTITLRHYISIGVATIGLGFAVSAGSVNEYYSEIKIWKLD